MKNSRNLEMNNINPQDRRADKRIERILPVVVRFNKVNAQAITSHSITDNISNHGVHIQVPYLVTIGTIIFVMIELPNKVYLAARGTVVRIQQMQQGLTGMGISFFQMRFLSNTI